MDKEYPVWLKHSKLEWKKYPDEKPIERGYYYTSYFNIDENQEYMKCIWWDPNTQKWSPWRPNGTPQLRVLMFAPSTRSGYYGECNKYQREDEIYD